MKYVVEFVRFGGKGNIDNPVATMKGIAFICSKLKTVVRKKIAEVMNRAGSQMIGGNVPMAQHYASMQADLAASDPSDPVCGCHEKDPS